MKKNNNKMKLSPVYKLKTVLIKKEHEKFLIQNPQINFSGLVRNAIEKAMEEQNGK